MVDGRLGIVGAGGSVFKYGWDWVDDDDWECDRWWVVGEDADAEIAGDGCDALLTGVPDTG